MLTIPIWLRKYPMSLLFFILSLQVWRISQHYLPAPLRNIPSSHRISHFQEFAFILLVLCPLFLVHGYTPFSYFSGNTNYSSWYLHCVSSEFQVLDCLSVSLVTVLCVPNVCVPPVLRSFSERHTSSVGPGQPFWLLGLTLQSAQLSSETLRAHAVGCFLPVTTHFLHRRILPHLSWVPVSRCGYSGREVPGGWCPLCVCRHVTMPCPSASGPTAPSTMAGLESLSALIFLKRQTTVSSMCCRWRGTQGEESAVSGKRWVVGFLLLRARPRDHLMAWLGVLGLATSANYPPSTLDLLEIHAFPLSAVGLCPTQTKSMLQSWVWNLQGSRLETQARFLLCALKAEFLLQKTLGFCS